METEKEDTSSEDEFRKWCEASCVELPLSRRTVFFSPRSLALTPIRAYERLRAVAWRKASCSGTERTSTKRRSKIDPVYAEAAEKGLWRTVIPQYVIDAFPELVGLFDASRNAGTTRVPSQISLIQDELPDVIRALPVAHYSRVRMAAREMNSRLRFFVCQI